MRGLFGKLQALLRRKVPRQRESTPPPVVREPVDHVVLLDGTMADLAGMGSTSIALVYNLLREAGPRASLYYGKGLQWREWRQFSDAVLGWGVERQIQRAYGWLATRYRPGDRIFLIGYSRGAFAVRALAGIIDRVGLLRAEAATERNVRLAWRYYDAEAARPAVAAFRHRFCHETAPVEMLGAFDTVMALGLQLPLMWVVSEPRYRFHDQRPGPSLRHCYQALALNETRSVFEPLIWDSSDARPGQVEQVWFRGCHGDIGGQLGGAEAARPLANIPLVWMLEMAERHGLALPEGWREQFPCDPQARSAGNWRGWGKIFLLRAPRLVGRDPSERIHESAVGARVSWRTMFVPAVWRRAGRDLRGGAAHDQAGGGAGGVEPAVGDAAQFAARDAG
jgi:uncharacterized protein (DUF2235 family)